MAVGLSIGKFEVRPKGGKVDLLAFFYENLLDQSCEEFLGLAAWAVAQDFAELTFRGSPVRFTSYAGVGSPVSGNEQVVWGEKLTVISELYK